MGAGAARWMTRGTASSTALAGWRPRDATVDGALAASSASTQTPSRHVNDGPGCPMPHAPKMAPRPAPPPLLVPVDPDATAAAGVPICQTPLSHAQAGPGDG